VAHSPETNHSHYSARSDRIARSPGTHHSHYSARSDRAAHSPGKRCSCCNACWGCGRVPCLGSCGDGSRPPGALSHPWVDRHADGQRDGNISPCCCRAERDGEVWTLSVAMEHNRWDVAIAYLFQENVVTHHWCSLLRFYYALIVGSSLTCAEVLWVKAPAKWINSLFYRNPN
jgi:hypothetical protein